MEPCSSISLCREMVKQTQRLIERLLSEETGPPIPEQSQLRVEALNRRKDYNLH